MIRRYEQPEIAEIWSDENKFALWRRTELAVIEARVRLGKVGRDVFEEISTILFQNPTDLDWLREREKETQHDLNAFLDECLRFLSPELQQHFHEGMTSYDTEESPFGLLLRQSLELVEELLQELLEILPGMAVMYRCTVMMARTHGQEAKMQSFGKRNLVWYQDLRLAQENLRRAKENLRFSKMSGAIGTYGDLDAETEAEALKILGFQPYYGATQIMPREIYAPVAQAVCQVVLTLEKIALAIRLGARSGRPIYQEPFGKKQKGSSAMPGKKNTISTEQIEGMARMARGYLSMILENIRTWEERAIEQSCVERVAWPDLFHVTIHSLRVMKKVLSGLRVYPDNMLREIVESRGNYASEDAKAFLKNFFDAETAYRIVQLAAFNVFVASRNFATPSSLFEVDALLLGYSDDDSPRVSIQEIILQGNLKVCPDLALEETEINDINVRLKEIFTNAKNVAKWNGLFLPSFQLRGEEILFEKILGETWWKKVVSNMQQTIRRIL